MVGFDDKFLIQIRKDGGYKINRQLNNHGDNQIYK